MNKRILEFSNSHSKGISVLGLIFVVLIWGLSPIFTLELYNYYSATFKVFISEIILIVTYLIIAGKNLKLFNKNYLKVAIPTGIFYSLANILQKIGLQFTTPAKYAFLENLSCITVPILMYFFIKKKPNFLTIFSCVLCLISVFILNGISFSSGINFGKGEILCALAGLFYGVNIAGTGAFAKDLNVTIYLLIQSVISCIMSLIFSIALNFIPITSLQGGIEIVEPMEKIKFSFELWPIFFLIIVTLLTSALCWIIRTKSMKHVDATFVATIMPFSAVVTGIVSVILGRDTLSLNLILGGVLGLVAIILSGYSDILFNKNNKQLECCSTALKQNIEKDSSKHKKTE